MHACILIEVLLPYVRIILYYVTWQCAKMSVLIFRKILRDRSKVLSSFVRSGLGKTDVQFIEEMIDHDESSSFTPQV